MKNNSTCGLSLFHGKLKRNKEKEKSALKQKKEKFLTSPT